MSEINQKNNFQSSKNHVGQNYTGANIINQSNIFHFTINKNYIIVLLLILILVSLFFNYELNKNVENLKKENRTLRINVITDQKFDREAEEKRIRALIEKN